MGDEEVRRGPAGMQEHQLDVVSDRESDTKVVTGGYRSGKTVTGVGCSVDMGFRSLLKDGGLADGLVVGPTFRFVNDVIVRNFQNFLTRWKLPHNYHKSDRILTIGRRRRFDIFCRSADDPRAFEGITAGWLWGDEWELWHPDALMTAFGRVSIGPVMQKLLTGTAEGFSANAETILGGRDLATVLDRPNWKRLQTSDGKLAQWLVNTEANKELPPGYVEAMKRVLDEDAQAEKLGGIRRAKTGRVYRRFDRAIHTGVPCVGVGRGEVQVWADFNVAKMHWVVVEASPTSSSAHIVGEIIGKNTDTAEQAEKTKTWLAEYFTRTRGRVFTAADVAEFGVPVWCDASGTQRTAVTALTHVKLLQQAGFKTKHGARNPLVDDRVNTVNVMLRDRRLTIDARAAKGAVDSLEKQTYVNGQPDKTTGLDAAADAIGYGCHWQWPATREVAEAAAPPTLVQDRWGVR